MGVFISLTTDAFTNTFNSQLSGAGGSGRAGATSARRPLRGLEIKDDTYAVIKVVQADGTPLSLFDSSSSTGKSTEYTNFILQTVTEARMEKHQIVETFGEPYIFFFGESPRFLDVTAVLIDSHDFNWYAEFWKNYDTTFRGTKLVEQGARTYLFYDDNIVEGYMLQAQCTKTADQPFMCMLTFRLYLTNYQNITFVGDPKFPTRTSISLPPDVTLTAADEFNGDQSVNPNDLLALNQAALDAVNQAAQQQLSGFGGAFSLSASLSFGITSTGSPNIDSVLDNAAAAIPDLTVRTKPLRELISANVDEYTGYVPPPLFPPPDPMDDQEDDQAGQPDAPDLQFAAVLQVSLLGGDISSPDALGGLGLSVKFGASVGFGLNGSTGASATFGAGTGSNSAGGVNGGLGFTGGFTASTNLAATSSTPTTPTAAAAKPVYGNGVSVSAGLSQGTGIGGGIPGGVGKNSLALSAGGKSYAQGNGFVSSQGYGGGLSANGASVNVGGAPSAFAVVSVPASVKPNPAAPLDLFIGPDGNASKTNTTGITV